MTEDEKKKKNKAKKTMMRLIGQWPQVGSTILVLTTERKNLTYRKKRIRMWKFETKLWGRIFGRQSTYQQQMIRQQFTMKRIIPFIFYVEFLSLDVHMCAIMDECQPMAREVHTAAMGHLKPMAIGQPRLLGWGDGKIRHSSLQRYRSN